MKFTFHGIMFAFVCSFFLFNYGQAATVGWMVGQTYTIPDDTNTYTLDWDFTLTDNLTINGTLEVLADGSLTDDDSDISLINGTLNVYGDVYSYNNLDHGTSGNPSSINIYYPGNLYVLGGVITYGDTDSALVVEQGGSLYNYYGSILSSGAPILQVKLGGHFWNVRGNNPGTSGFFTGSNFFDSNEVHLDKNLDIDYTWTITDEAVINGHGRKITFGPDGVIQILGDSASLILQDVVLENVSGNKIQCTDLNTTLSLHNVVWIQDADFTYTYGMMHVSGDWEIRGEDTAFVFESNKALSVESNATVHLKHSTFTYNAASDASLLDLSGSIVLEFGTLKATEDCSLGSGSIVVDGVGVLQGDSRLDLRLMGDVRGVGGLRRVGDVFF